MFPLLPPSGLDLSALVAVLIGTLVLAWLSEAFGWSFGGLVVPGYLASLLIVSPASGSTIVAEAVLSVALLRGTDLLARTGVWSRFFGRERFLLLVLLSILVRQSSEIWLWPALLARQDAWLGFRLLQPGEAHSVGLVLVPLTANALGRGGTWNGLRQLVVPTAIAYAGLHEVLALTNVSFSAMSLTYEDVSLDFLQSARAYFVLAAGALAATLLNGALAWSAGGILIPALLGLAWYEPARILATFVEAIVIAIAFRGLVRLPVVRDWNIEGARKLALLFVLSAVYRIGTSWIHHAGIPIRTEELAGLGYLLSALIALKILQFGSAPTVLLPAVGTSLLAFLGGSSAAWALSQVLPVEEQAEDTVVASPSVRLLRTPEGVVELARTRTRLDPERFPSIHLPAARLSGWRDLWRDLRTIVPERAVVPPGGWLTIERGTGELGQRAWWIVREATEDLDAIEGWGTAIVREEARGPALRAERIWSQPDAARAALGRCVEVDCRMLLFTGMELPTGTDDARDAFDAAVGEVAVVTADAPPPSRPAGPPQRSLSDALLLGLETPTPRWSPSPTELDFLTSTLVPAADGWAQGTAGYGELSRLAGAIGYAVEPVSGCGEGGCVLLSSPEGGPTLVLRAGGTPVSVVASRPRTEAGTLALALGAFESLGAEVLLIDPAAEVTPVEPTRDPMQALHFGWRRTLEGREGARTLWFRGLGPGTPDRPAPEVDVVLGTGRPVFENPPVGVADLVQGGQLVGTWTARWAAAGEDEAGLAGNHLAGPRLSAELGGAGAAVLWFSDGAREAWRAGTRADTADWFRAAGLELVDRSSAETPSSGFGKTNANFEELTRLARAAAHQHNLSLLRRLTEAAGPDLEVRASWDPVRALPYVSVVARTTKGVRESRSWAVAGDGRLVTLGARAGADEIRAALGWAPADVIFEPEQLR